MYGRSVLAYIPVNLANILVSFGTIIVLTRVLPSAEFGIYALAVVTLHFVQMGLSTWLDASVARYYARNKQAGKTHHFLKSIFVTASVIAIISLFIIFSILAVLPLETRLKTVLVFAFSVLGFRMLSNICMETHIAAHNIWRYSTLFTLQTVIAFTLGIILILKTPLQAEGPFLGLLFGYILSLTLDGRHIFQKIKGGVYDITSMKTYFNYGLPISLSLLLTYTLNSADLYLITSFLGTEATGQYNAGYNLANRSVDVLFIWISMALTPIIISAMEEDGIEHSRTILKDCGSAMLFIALPAATGIALIAEPAGFILGESVRAEAVKVIPFIAFAGVMNGMITYYAHRAFMLSEKTSMFLLTMLPAVILNIILNILLIPQYGLMGAVYATLIAYALGLILAFLIGRRYYPLPIPVRDFFEISSACLIMAVCVYFTPINENWPEAVIVILKCFIGVISYGLTCLLFNVANCRIFAKSILVRFKNRHDVTRL